MSTRALRKKKDADAPIGDSPLTLASPNGSADEPMDLAELFASETATLKITDPRYLGRDKRLTSFRLEISSIFSEEARAAAKAHADKVKLVDGRVDPNDPGLRDVVFEEVIAATRRWWQEGVTTDGITILGELVPCTPETVRRVFTDPRTAWMYPQARDFYLSLANFFGVPPRTV